MKFIKKCSNLFNLIATLVKSAMPWRRGEYNVQLSEQKSQTSGEVPKTSNGKVELLSDIILDDYGARARKILAGHEPTAPCNSGESTKWSEKHPPEDRNMLWQERLEKEGKATDERGVKHAIV